MEQLLFKNVRAIITCDPEDRVFYDADILVEGPAISAIGKDLDAPGAQVIDCCDQFLYPGLINTHHHFFQAFVRILITIDRSNMTVM